MKRKNRSKFRLYLASESWNSLEATKESLVMNLKNCNVPFIYAKIDNDF